MFYWFNFCFFQNFYWLFTCIIQNKFYFYGVILFLSIKKLIKMENELKPAYQLIETNIKTGKKSICKSFYTYVDAKKHLKEFYEFLIDDRIQKIESLKIQYTAIGYTTSEITTMINADIKVPVLFNRNTSLLDDGFKFEIKKIK